MTIQTDRVPWGARARELRIRLGLSARPLRRYAGRLARVCGFRPAPLQGPAGTGSPPDGPSEVLHSLVELDRKLEEVDLAGAVSDDAMRAVFQGFRMEPPTGLPDDPTSQEYRDRQFDLYRSISRRSSYEVGHERSDFAVNPDRPFPYYTESSETVGHQLMAVGQIIAAMGLPPNASILELGAGWGNTTLPLARMGYRITAIDVDPTFVGLIRDRGSRIGLQLDVRTGEFLEVDRLEATYDAVLFYESFHHCSDHRLMLRKLESTLSPGGRIFFAAEPIDDSFPVPWGLRLDGESLWAVRRNGWLELGFQESYFLRTLQQLGWLTTKHVSPSTHLGTIFEARRAGGTYELGTFRLPPDEDRTWSPPTSETATAWRRSGRQSVITLEQGAPYATLEVECANPGLRPVSYRLEHGRSEAEGSVPPGRYATIGLPYDPAAEQLVVRSTAGRVGLGVATIRLT